MRAPQARPPRCGLRTHGGSEAHADGAAVRSDVAHGIKNGHPGGDGAAGRVDVDGDVLSRVRGVQVQQLRNNQVGHIVVHGAAQPDYALRPSGRASLVTGWQRKGLSASGRCGDGPTCAKSWLMTWLNRSITIWFGGSAPPRATMGCAGAADCEMEVKAPRTSRDCASRAASGLADEGVHSLQRARHVCLLPVTIKTS